jgi:hypothetical protein
MLKQIFILSALAFSAMISTAAKLENPTIFSATSANAAKMASIRMSRGEPQKLGNGVVQSFVSLDACRNPVSIGVTFTKAALSGLPKISQEYALSPPSAASASAFQYVLITWNPQGHQPTGIYDVPHFDFHFYSLSPTERQQIKAIGDDRIKALKLPLPAFIPPDYIPEPTPPAPGEGRHWIDTRSPEFRGQPFGKTFIYGTYDGEIIFAEPMLTKDLLETHPNTREAISLPAAYAKSAYYPTHYGINYDRTQQVYSVSLDGLTFRSQSLLHDHHKR